MANYKSRARRVSSELSGSKMHKRISRLRSRVSVSTWPTMHELKRNCFQSFARERATPSDLDQLGMTREAFMVMPLQAHEPAMQRDSHSHRSRDHARKQIWTFRGSHNEHRMDGNFLISNSGHENARHSTPRHWSYSSGLFQDIYSFQPKVAIFIGQTSTCVSRMRPRPGEEARLQNHLGETGGL